MYWLKNSNVPVSRLGRTEMSTYLVLLPNSEHDALNSTLSRTLNTSLTTLIVLLAIFIFGGESLRGFMFAMIVGVIIGTYSSVFIATPIMFDSLKNKMVTDKK